MGKQHRGLYDWSGACRKRKSLTDFEESFMGSVFEVGMLLCFGASWPFNIVKSYRSRTAGGKSIGFELLIMVGYLCGIAGKLITHNVNFVLCVYILDLAMVAADFTLTLRNRKLDALSAKGPCNGITAKLGHLKVF